MIIDESLGRQVIVKALIDAGASTSCTNAALTTKAKLKVVEKSVKGAWRVLRDVRVAIHNPLTRTTEASGCKFGNMLACSGTRRIYHSRSAQNMIYTLS